MTINIDAYLREYIINGFAAGTSGRCGVVIDEFTDMWCDIDRDGHKYFFKLFGRKKNWRDHVMLKSYKNAFQNLCDADEIVLETIGSMSLDENMKKFFVKAMFDILISDDLNSKLNEKMNKILKEGKSLKQLNWEYEQEDLWNGHPPSEGTKYVRNSIIEKVKDKELLFKGTNEQIHSVVEKCKYILDSSLMNSPCSKEMLQRSHENNKERMANIEKYLDHKKEKGVINTNDSPQSAFRLCNAMPDNIKSTFNPAFIQNIVERNISYNIMVVTLTDQNTIDGLLKLIGGCDIIGLLKEFKEYRKNKTIYYHVSKISGSCIPVFGDRVYKVVDTYGPRPQNIFWRETMYDECTQFTGRFPSKPDKCFSNLNTQEKIHCVREYFNGSYEFSHKYLSESIVGHVFAEPKQYYTDSSDDGGSSEAPPSMAPDGHSTAHGYDYDLIVIGGGSGGLACSKEAARLGAKTAVLDFVKPSPAGSTWGLGGTCVNVGCIPKKLMHNAALIGSIIGEDAKPFGFNVDQKGHSWADMRESVQNHIRGLNFNYRVTLREKEVTYLNKLGKFVDAHTLQLTDKKGKESTVTASRFIIAVGGRPSPLDCEGGELAISSDDVFSLENPPGKTLCVGASYISLECAGFLAGIGTDTTVAVRSILLRGFDREIADKIGAHMEDHGVKFKKGVVPNKLEKTADGKINVTFSDGSSEVYDTVLAAIGRYADTAKLGLENIGVAPKANNGKIPCVLDQTTQPNVYAIGDVMDGCPELTPVAIQAGKLLARRLFNSEKTVMDYRNVCTTVFTPLEYGCVGYNEDDAKKEFGDDNVDVFHSNFIPLEWSLSEHRAKHPAFAKIVVAKDTNNVLGIHFLGPHAGEVTQGFGVAIKKGITMDDLLNTVGIHPTSAEVLTDLTVSKSSGESADAKGC